MSKLLKAGLMLLSVVTIGSQAVYAQDYTLDDVQKVDWITKSNEAKELDSTIVAKLVVEDQEMPVLDARLRVKSPVAFKEFESGDAKSNLEKSEVLLTMNLLGSSTAIGIKDGKGYESVDGDSSKVYLSQNSITAEVESQIDEVNKDHEARLTEAGLKINNYIKVNKEDDNFVIDFKANKDSIFEWVNKDFLPVLKDIVEETGGSTDAESLDNAIATINKHVDAELPNVKEFKLTYTDTGMKLVFNYDDGTDNPTHIIVEFNINSFSDVKFDDVEFVDHAYEDSDDTTTEDTQN